MLIQTLQNLFQRDLNRVKTEIELYSQEERIWHTEKNIANAAGNLCLHLVGNLNTYIGAQLGKTNYIRHRVLEFSLKGIPRAELVQQLSDTMLVVHRTLDGLTDDALAKEYPLVVFEQTTTTAYLLVHLATHLSYHHGQINYHRRLLDV